MGIHGAKKYRRKSGICVAELAQQVELSGKHWISAKLYSWDMLGLIEQEWRG